MTTRDYRALLTALVWAFALVPLGAAPSVESVAPPGGQRGTEFVLTLTGAGLGDAREVLLYESGVTCAGVKVVSETEVQVSLKATVDCPLGGHAFRVRTARGVSELRTFRVTPFPFVAEREPNDTRAGAQAVGPNLTVAGVLDEGDVDCYKIDLKKGQRLSAEVEAVRIGAGLLDPVLTVYDPDGKELTTVDDTPLLRQDAFATLLAPADGTYVVQVRETNYNGDENSRYLLHVGHFPRPAVVFPAGGPAGEEVAVRFFGAAGEIEQKVRLPKASAPDFGLYATDAGLTAPSPNPFRVSPFPNVIEVEPNEDGAKATRAGRRPPLALNGVVGRKGDLDRYCFTAARGDAFEIEVFAYRIGSPLDSVLSIFDADGRLVVANDDDGSHDSRLRFFAPADGEYFLEVKDKRGQGGPEYVYRVEVAPPRREINVFLPRPDRMSQKRQAIVVPRGNRVTAFLAVQRTGFSGEVKLKAAGLPVGVALSADRVAADRFLVPVVFEAAADAPLGASLIDVHATGEGDVKGGFVQVVDLVNGPADALYHAAVVGKLAVVVVEEGPFKVTLSQAAAPLVRDGTLELKAKVERNQGFTGGVEVSLPFLPPWVEAPAVVTIPAERTEEAIVLRAFPGVEPRNWKLIAEARPAPEGGRRPFDPAALGMGGGGGRRRRSGGENVVPVASALVSLNVAETPVTGTIAPVSGEQGKSVKVVCAIRNNEPLPERLKAVLEGLPNRVAVEPVEVAAGAKEVAFTVKLDPTAPLGTFESLVCRLSGTAGGQPVSYCVGRGGVLKIVPAGGVVTDESGRPLSPLDALRREQKKESPK